MNEHRKILTLESCVKEANGVLGRAFGNSYIGLYVVKELIPGEIPLAEGATPGKMNVLYWDYSDWDPMEREFEYKEHKDDRAFSAEIILEALRRSPSIRSQFIKGVIGADESLLVEEKAQEEVKVE